MASEGSEWPDKLLVIGLILILAGIALLCIVGIIFVASSPIYMKSDLVRSIVLAAIILIVTGAVMLVVLNRLGY